AEEGCGDRQASDDDRIAAVHHAGEARIDGNHAFRRDVVPAAGQAGAEVFVQRLTDEAVEIEAGKGERQGRGLLVVPANAGIAVGSPDLEASGPGSSPGRRQCTNLATTSR